MNNYKIFINQFTKISNTDEYDWIEINDSYSDNLELQFEAPDNSPYKNGIYRIQLEFINNYPQNPPNVKFITKIWHPLVEFSSGKMCQDYFKENWSDDANIKHFLALLKNFLINYNFSSGVNIEAINDIKENIFEKKAKEINKKYAID